MGCEGGRPGGLGHRGLTGWGGGCVWFVALGGCWGTPARFGMRLSASRQRLDKAVEWRRDGSARGAVERCPGKVGVCGEALGSICFLETLGELEGGV